MVSLLTNPLLREVLVSSALQPALIAAAVLVTAVVLRRQAAGSATAPAFAAGFVVAVFPDVLPLHPGRIAYHWLPAAAVAALIAGLLSGAFPWRLARVSFRLAVAGLASWLLVPTHLGTAVWWVVPALALVILAEWDVLERIARSAPGAQVPLILALAFSAGSVVILHAHCARLAEVALIAAGSLTGLAVVSGWARVECVVVVPAAAVLLPGTLLAGATETGGEMPEVCFALVALAPLLLAATLVPGLRRWPLARLALVRLALVLVPLVGAVVLAACAESIYLE